MTAHRSIILLGTSSIGAALSKRLAAKGFTLHFAGRREDALKALVQQYNGSSYSMIDAMEPATMEQAVADAAAAAKAAEGHLVGLAYLCGSIPLKSLRASKAADFTDAYMVNVVSAAMLLKAAAPHMAKAPGGGSAVFFSSVAASVGFPQHSAIASAKAGLEGLARSAAAELSPITRVNAIAPSLTDTPLASRLLASQASRDALAKLHPLGRVGTADDHASLASWLLDSSESGWVTGQVFGCDGGRSTIQK
jgi:NAD(P)-dependent dehydrogenase (short-subunit alcohol dehydrogenase family)